MDYLANTLTNPTGCREWQGNRNARGYGRYGKKANLVHRLVMGSPPDAVVMHLCHNPPCINPDHLEVGTQVENIRMTFDARTHCVNGHPVNSENTMQRGKHSNACRVCKNEANLRYYHRTQEVAE